MSGEAWRKGWVMKISEVKEREAREGGKVRLRVVVRASHHFYEGGGVCAVQVG